MRWLFFPLFLCACGATDDFAKPDVPIPAEKGPQAIIECKQYADGPVEALMILTVDRSGYVRETEVETEANVAVVSCLRTTGSRLVFSEHHGDHNATIRIPVKL